VSSVRLCLRRSPRQEHCADRSRNAAPRRTSNHSSRGGRSAPDAWAEGWHGGCFTFIRTSS